jgi:hypothetical protein
MRALTASRRSINLRAQQRQSRKEHIMQGKKSRRCRTRQNRVDVRLKKAKQGLAYCQREAVEGAAYYAALIARLEAKVAA